MTYLADTSLADFGRREIAVARRLRTFAVCAALALAVPGNADPHAEFTAAFEAYREAMDESEYGKAVEYAEKARQLGETVFPDDAKLRATLAWNHGFALSRTYSGNPATYPILKEARKLMSQAFGRDSEHLVRVEALLLNSAPDATARRHLTELLKLARRHYPEDSDLLAGIKLMGGSQVWWDPRAKGLLGEAAETFGRLGQTARQARAQFWIGKIQFGRDKFRDAAETMTRVVELLPADHPTALMARANLVEAYEEIGESERATEHCLAIGRTVPWTGTADYMPLFKAPPTYPRTALARKVEGYVLLEFTVDDMGFVRDPLILESKAGRGRASGEVYRKDLEVAAVEAARKFRYAPKFVEGEPVAVDGVRNRIVFELVP